ncbi:MAG: hypothetical protein HQK84_11020 [Nitrospinae bacterium]|nr:hypothetical protein [Nitrospinota bacterium]
MSNFFSDDEIFPISTMKMKPGVCINYIEQTGRPALLMTRKVPKAVILTVSQYEKIIEKFQLIEDKELAIQQIKEGEGIIHCDAYEQLMKHFNR